jgi:hypothetical protein
VSFNPLTWPLAGKFAAVAVVAAVAAALVAGCDSTSPSPTPTVTTPSPTPATTSPSPTRTTTGWNCVTSAAIGNCGPYYYPPNTMSSGYNTYVGQDVWNTIPGWQQTVYANNPGDWQVTANMPDGNTAVVSYPSSSQGASGNGTQPLISSYATLVSSFSEDMHATAKTDAEAAFDIWTGAGDEIMIQHDESALRPRCGGPAPVLATVGFAEPGTGTVQQWNFCPYGGERIWQLTGNEQAGSVDMLAMLMWLENHGYLPANSTLSLVGYGFEVCSTGGVPETFTVSSYSLKGVSKGAAETAEQQQQPLPLPPDASIVSSVGHQS